MFNDGKEGKAYHTIFLAKYLDGSHGRMGCGVTFRIGFSLCFQKGICGYEGHWRHTIGIICYDPVIIGI